MLLCLESQAPRWVSRLESSGLRPVEPKHSVPCTRWFHFREPQGWEQQLRTRLDAAASASGRVKIAEAGVLRAWAAAARRCWYDSLQCRRCSGPVTRVEAPPGTQVSTYGSAGRSRERLPLGWRGSGRRCGGVGQPPGTAGPSSDSSELRLDRPDPSVRGRAERFPLRDHQPWFLLVGHAGSGRLRALTSNSCRRRLDQGPRPFA